jgi:hypothetical protein
VDEGDGFQVVVADADRTVEELVAVVDVAAAAAAAAAAAVVVVVAAAAAAVVVERPLDAAEGRNVD